MGLPKKKIKEYVCKLRGYGCDYCCDKLPCDERYYTEKNPLSEKFKIPSDTEIKIHNRWYNKEDIDAKM
jgi:hypothetical protein